MSVGIYRVILTLHFSRNVDFNEDLCYPAGEYFSTYQK